MRPPRQSDCRNLGGAYRTGGDASGGGSGLRSADAVEQSLPSLLLDWIASGCRERLNDSLTQIGSGE
jgi:hypothetical protein